MLSTQLNDTSKGPGDSKKGGEGKSESRNPSRSPSKGRSMSDSSPPVLSPSPRFREPEKRSKDDISVDNPVTPRRPAYQLRGLSLQMPPRELRSADTYDRMPLSPKLDRSNTYGSPASIIPRRSRGLDFSRAATNLHHSTLAEQSSPDSSPTITGRAMNIPNRRSGHWGGIAESPSGNSGSLWSTMTGADRTAVSSSLGSVNMLGSDSSGSNSEDEMMDADDIDESIITTPVVNRSSSLFGGVHGSPGSQWMTTCSSAASSLMNFQRARMRHGKNSRNRKTSSSGSGSSMTSPKSRSPPVLRGIEGVGNNYMNKDLAPGTHSRRESISWAANQLHISGSESDDGTRKNTLESADGLPSTPGRDGQRGVIRRPVTRRGNMLPKTKGFARIRAALAEESAPVETEVRREAAVVKQVRESDMDLEPTRHASIPIPSTAQSSPSVGPALVDPLDDIPEDDLMADSSSMPSTDKGLSSSFKQQAMRNSKGKDFWETFPEDHHRTPPPPAFLPRASSSGISDDIPMDSPSLSTGSSSLHGASFVFPLLESQDTQLPSTPSAPSTVSQPIPTAADITRRMNNKRRRDDDLDPTSFKRRAVSPGMSVHNSPVMQSPMQRDVNPWGTRPSTSNGSGGSDKSTPGPGGAEGVGNGAGNGAGRVNGTRRIGFQGMVDTNDGLMKMSIE